MATSRGATPADPTLQATTDDDSRGGLFNRSNVGNVVNGIAVDTSATINNNRITIDINGTSHSFTLNQATDETLTFTVEGGGGGGGTGNAFNGATYSNNIITLTREDGSASQTVNLSDLNDSAAIATLNGMLSTLTTRVDNLNFTGIGQTPDSLTGQGGQFLRVNTAEDSLEFVPEPTSSVSPSSFSSTDSSILIEANASLVNLEAQPTWTGNTNRGGVTGNVNVTRLVLDASTNLILRDDGNGVYTITTPSSAPAQGNAMVALTVPQTETAFTAPTPPSGTVSAESGSTITSITGTISGGENNVNIPATTTIAADMMSATVTFPATTTDGGAEDYGADGEYTVTTMTTVSAPGATDRVIETTRMFNRFVPFYQVRRSTAPTTLAHLQAGTESDAPYVNTTGITTIGGTGNYYFATTVLTSTSINVATNTTLFGARMNVRHVGTISTTDYGNDPLVYNVYQIAGVQGNQMINNFRAG